ncbi:FadR/GntR family transcriptional regulator [Nocardia sp. NBC_01388]|uniref:FadR/GntR family transcriptional regulator n=1 Tax=Nocardia sp. NBC_01388 TaxID=2903596 RepID=UPI003252BE5A
MAGLSRIAQNITLAQQVADELRARIASGEWPVGTKIPSEPELVKALGVSRSTLREAVRSLAQVRMLETRRGDGTYVRSDNTLEFPLLDRIAHAQVREVLEIRAMLEEYTVRVAAQRCTPADAEILRALLTGIEGAAAQTNSFSELLPAGIAFYEGLSAVAGNQLLADLYRHLSAAQTDEPFTHFGDEYLARWKSLLAELVDAIAANRPARAEEVMRLLQIAAVNEVR